MKIPFVDLLAQYKSIKEEIDQAISDVIHDSAFIGGKYLKTFEQNYANYIGTKQCIGVGNGTDALFLTLKALGIGKGHEVITVSNSFIATPEAITMTGAKVVFVDCDIHTYNIDVQKIESAITSNTKAILPVHLYGQPADMDPIIEIAQRYNLHVVEDAAQAHGAEYKSKKAGTTAPFACFSFFPGKNLGAYGDAGAIVTSNEEFAEKARMLANHGRKEKYNHEFEGINSRLDGLQAAILDVKLKHLEKWIERRRAIAKIYDEELKNIVITPDVLPDVRHVYHLYVIRVKNRNRIKEFLAEREIHTGIHYPIPLPFLKAYGYIEHKPEDFPTTYLLKDEILSLPIHGSMSDDQVEYVIKQLKIAVNRL
ncbi:DegT/DnrJ/EryC1/StrS family aminotransferase [bacterium]|nr:DegT/DnrJ/EryC1/StrS family aminotransferase [bacterium]